MADMSSNGAADDSIAVFRKESLRLCWLIGRAVESTLMGRKLGAGAERDVGGERHCSGLSREFSVRPELVKRTPAESNRSISLQQLEALDFQVRVPVSGKRDQRPYNFGQPYGQFKVRLAFSGILRFVMSREKELKGIKGSKGSKGKRQTENFSFVTYSGREVAMKSVYNRKSVRTSSRK